MFCYGYAPAVDHDYPFVSSRRESCRDFLAPYPLIDPKTGEVHHCSQGTLQDGYIGTKSYENLSTEAGPYPGTMGEAPLFPSGWGANTPLFPACFPQLYVRQQPENLDAFLSFPATQQNKIPSCLLANGLSAYPILPIGADSLVAAPSEQNRSVSSGYHRVSIENSFPLSNNEHSDLRQALVAVMTSPWKLQNVVEPHQSTLLEFLRYEAGKKRWHCCFWIKGTPCSCSFSKKDQAKNHIRFHIGHLPFSCNSRGICPKDGATCKRRFCSVEALQKHRGPQKECKDCGKLMLQSNLRRHSATACRNSNPGLSENSGIPP